MIIRRNTSSFQPFRLRPLDSPPLSQPAQPAKTALAGQGPWTQDCLHSSCFTQTSASHPHPSPHPSSSASSISIISRQHHTRSLRHAQLCAQTTPTSDRLVRLSAVQFPPRHFARFPDLILSRSNPPNDQTPISSTTSNVFTININGHLRTTERAG